MFWSTIIIDKQQQIARCKIASNFKVRFNQRQQESWMGQINVTCNFGRLTRYRDVAKTKEKQLFYSFYINNALFSITTCNFYTTGS